MKRNERISTKKNHLEEEATILYSKETKFLLRVILLLPIMRLFLILLAIKRFIYNRNKKQFQYRSQKPQK